jgi:hypothetical protein
MRTGRGQRVAAAGAVRGQPYPAMGAELPVRFELAAALAALVDEVAKLFLELQEGGLLPALLRRWRWLLCVHGVPSVFLGVGYRSLALSMRLVSPAHEEEVWYPESLAPQISPLLRGSR